MQQHELMAEVNGFKNSQPAIIFAVMGGRVSEGIDFPGSELEIEILEGIPYPKPTAKQRRLCTTMKLNLAKAGNTLSKHR